MGSGTAPADPEFSLWFARDFARVRAALTLSVGDPGLAEEAAAEAFSRALARGPAPRWPCATSPISPNPR